VARLYAFALDSCGNELTLDNTLHLTLEATAGSVYGSFLTAAGDTVPSPLSDVLYEDLRSGSIGFLANGALPDSIVPVTIRVTVPGTAIPPAEAVVLVDAPSCPLIVSTPSHILPGDTAALTVVRRRHNGVTDLYPPDQSFDLSISDGVGAGLLVAPDGTTDANTLFCTPGVGLRFAAADSIGGDSVRVEFRAAPVICGGTGPSSKGGRLDPIEACIPFGEVVVSRLLYPPCSDQTDLSRVTRRVEYHDCNGGGVTAIQKPVGLDFIDPQICFNQGGQCLALMIPEVLAEIASSICNPPPSPTLLIVNTQSHVPDRETAIRVVREFTRQIKRLQEIITLYKNAKGRRPRDDVSIDMRGVRSQRGLELHEAKHRELAFAHVVDALAKTKTGNTNCLPIQEARGLTQHELKDRINSLGLILKFEYSLPNPKKGDYNEDEAIAHKLQQDFLKNLTEKIKKIFHL